MGRKTWSKNEGKLKEKGYWVLKPVSFVVVSEITNTKEKRVSGEHGAAAKNELGTASSTQ